MRKYELLQNYVRKCGKEKITLAFEEIEQIAGVPVDHFFVRYRKELKNKVMRLEKYP